METVKEIKEVVVLYVDGTKVTIEKDSSYIENLKEIFNMQDGESGEQD